MKIHIFIIALFPIFFLTSCTDPKKDNSTQRNIVSSGIEIRDLQGNIVFQSDFNVDLHSNAQGNIASDLKPAKGEKIYDVSINATEILNSMVNFVDATPELKKYNIQELVTWPFQILRDNEKYYLCWGGSYILKEYKVNQTDELFKLVTDYLENEHIPNRIANLKRDKKRSK